MRWKTVRIFISSTFNDMHAERDYLVKHVFPELSVWCEERKLRLVDIDLRWGVTAADSQANNAVLACLRNIDESRPFFLCLLGQRRGWVPKDSEISELTLDNYPGVKEHMGKRSVTEMEIEHALLAPMHRIVNERIQSPAPVNHALFFFRNNPFYGDALTRKQRNIYTNAAADDPGKAEEELECFKTIVAQNWMKVSYYDCVWNKNIVTPELLTEGEDTAQGRLCEFSIAGTALKDIMISQLKSEIENEFPDNRPCEAQTALERDLEQQEQFIEMISEGFIPRKGDFDTLDRYLDNESNHVFVLTAAAGLGKTTLLANYVTKLKSDKRKVFARFCGASDLSTGQYTLWKSIFDEAEVDCPPTMAELRRDIAKLLEKLNGIMVIDAVNQLPGGLEMLLWLPSVLPPALKLVVSVKEDEESAPVIEKVKAYGATVASVAPFASDDDKEKLIGAYLEKYLKHLDKAHITSLCEASASRNPLYLKIVLSELRVFGAYKKLDDEIGKFGINPLEAFGTVLQRLEQDAADIKITPKEAVSLLFGLLARARRGLSEAELVDCFSRKFRDMDDSDIRVVIRYYLRQMRPFMARREGRTDYLYESFKLAASDRYQETECTHHKLLADIFQHSADPNANFRFEGEQARAFEELPYHLVSCGETDTIEKMLVDYLWLYNKIRLCSVEQTIADYQYIEQKSARLNLLAVRDCLTLSAHILQKDFKQLPSQLWGRLPDGGEARALLLQAKKETAYPWLRPERPFMSASGGDLIKTINCTIPFGCILNFEDCFLHPVGLGNTVKMVRFTTGECVNTLQLPAPARAMCLYGETLIAGLNDNTIALISVKTNQCVAILRGHTHALAQVAVRDDELISLDAMGTAKLWSLTDHSCRATHETNIRDAIKLEVYHDKLIAVVIKSELYKSVVVYSLKSQEQVHSWDEFTSTLRDMKISEDALYATTKNGVCVFSLDNFEKRAGWDGHGGWVDSLDISGHLLATGASDHTVKLWDMATGKCLKTFSGHSIGVKKVAFHEGHLVSCADEIKIWSLEGAADEAVGMKHQRSVNALVYQEPYLFSGSQDGTVRQWDTATYDCINIFNRPDGIKAWVLALARNENAIFAGYAGNRGQHPTLQGWSLQTGQPLMSFADCVHDVNAIALTNDSVVTAHNFRAGLGLSSLWVHSPVTGMKTAELGGVDGTMLDIKYHDGKLYGAGGEGILGIWSLPEHQCVFSAPLLGNWISSIDLESSDLYVACGFNSRKIGVMRRNETQWQFMPPAQMNVSRIVTAENHIIGFDRENDLLTVWNIESSEVQCDMHADESISSCTVLDNKVFCGTVNGNIYVMIPENFSFEDEPFLKADQEVTDVLQNS